MGLRSFLLPYSPYYREQSFLETYETKKEPRLLDLGPFFRLARQMLCPY